MTAEEMAEARAVVARLNEPGPRALLKGDLAACREWLAKALSAVDALTARIAESDAALDQTADTAAYWEKRAHYLEWFESEVESLRKQVEELGGTYEVPDW
jgi:phage shock protein A